MLELKEAYEILGLSEGAPRDEIEKKYGRLVRKYTADKSGEIDNTDVMNNITEAYNRLITYDNQLLEAAEPVKKPIPLFKLFGVDDKKGRNFFYYHKYQMIIGLIAVIFVGYLISSFITKPSDLNIFFIGEFAQKADNIELGDSIKKDIVKSFTDIKNVKFEMIASTADIKSQQDSVMNQKASIDLVYGDGDIMIVDKRIFSDAVENGIFENLDDISKTQGFDAAKNKDNRVLIAGQKISHLYGIDISATSIIKNSDILGKEYIAVIRSKCKHIDNAKKIMKWLINN